MSFYGSVGNRFGVTGPGYGIQGHRGQDFPNPAGTPVPAWEGGTVALVQYSPFLGTVVVIQMADGKYAGYAHLKTNPPIRVGQKINTGETIGVIAGPGDAHGSSWTGPHLHTTLGNTAQSVFFGYVTDPLPRIQNEKGTTLMSQTNAQTAGFDPQAAITGVTGIAAFLTNGGNWARIGTFVLGAILLLIAVTKILSDTGAGQTVISATKNVAKTAAVAATI
jgi:hypothetical protein